MPLTQEDLAALQGLMASQLGPIQSGLQGLQESVGSQFQAVNRQLTALTAEQERLAHEQMRQAKEAEEKFARIREEMAGLSVSRGPEDKVDGRNSPPRKQAKKEEDENMHDASTAGEGSQRGSGVSFRTASRRGSSQPSTRQGGDVAGGANPKVLWIKGFDGPRTQVYLAREAGKFLTDMGVHNGVVDPRSGQQSVKVQFSREIDAENALLKFRAQTTKGELRLVPDKDKLARTRDGLVGRAWREVEAALKREKITGTVSTNRGLVCVEKGADDIVCIVARVSYDAKLTVQPGHAAIGLKDASVLRLALEAIGEQQDG